MSARKDGKDVPLSTSGRARLVLAGNRFSFGPDSGTFAVVAGSSPPRMFVDGKTGPNADRTLLATFDLQGDTLAVAYQLVGEGASARVESAPGSGVLVVRFELFR